MRKTGSSYLQSMLALNRSLLKTQGVTYPTGGQDREAVKGLVSSGNAPSRRIHKTLRAVRKINPETSRVVISREQLHEEIGRYFLAGNRASSFEREISASLRVLDLQFILIVRDPFDWAVSKYQQSVKHDRVTAPFDDWIRSDAAVFPPGIDRFIHYCVDSGISVAITNYSRHSSRLWDEFLSHLGVDPESENWVVPNHERVNRSLSGSELFVQRIANQFEGWDAEGLFANNFISRRPDAPKWLPAVSDSSYAYFQSRNADYVNDLNSLIQPSEQMTFGPYEEKWGEALRAEQQEHLNDASQVLNILVEHLHKSTKKRRTRFRKQ